MSDQVPVWAFMGLLGLFQAVIIVLLNKLWDAIIANTAATTKMSIELPTVYATKEETNRHHDADETHFKELHERMYGVTNRVHNVDLRLTALDGSVQSARAELK